MPMPIPIMPMPIPIMPYDMEVTLDLLLPLTLKVSSFRLPAHYV